MIEPQTKVQTPPATTHQPKAPAEIHKASLAVQLNHFMQTPEDVELEQRFASRLQDAQFEALVAVGETGHVSQQKVTLGLKMSLGITTYLADGKRYIPVFTDPQVCHQFLKQSAPDFKMRTFSFTTQELMAEVARLQVAGLLINPGKQSFPLTLEYWQYATHVYAAIDGDATWQLHLLNAEAQDRAQTLVRRCKHIRGLEHLWLAQATASNQPDALVIIADYRGDADKFNHTLAAELARSAKDILADAQDVLVGLPSDDLGQKVTHQCAPVYTANHLFGRKSLYD